MLPLLIWLAGCAFGIYAIIHYGFYREMEALAVCGSVLLWIIGGASWIGKRLQVARGAAGPAKHADPFLDAINRRPDVQEAKRRAEELRSMNVAEPKS